MSCSYGTEAFSRLWVAASLIDWLGPTAESTGRQRSSAKVPRLRFLEFVSWSNPSGDALGASGNACPALPLA